MIPRIKVRTEISYLINVWGKEDESNSSIYMLWRTLSTSLFLFKKPMNQAYVTIRCKNLRLLNLLLYWKARRSQPENQTSQISEPRLYLRRQHWGWCCCQEPQLCLPPAAWPLLWPPPRLCYHKHVSLPGYFYPSSVSQCSSPQVPGSAQGREQTAGTKGRAALLLLLAARTSLTFMVFGENNHLMHSIHSLPMFL